MADREKEQRGSLPMTDNRTFVLKVLDGAFRSREPAVWSAVHFEVTWKKEINRDLRQGQGLK